MTLTSRAEDVTPVRHRTYFDPSGTSDLPPAARSWLLHAIEPGTPVYRQGTFTMHGEINLKRWRAFTAHQTITPESEFRWTARTRLAGLPVTGYDQYRAGAGAMRWRMLGVIPVSSAQGHDVTESAAGRLAAESVLVPSSLVHAQWEHISSRRAAFVCRIADRSYRIGIEVGDTGVLHRVFMRRWGSADGAVFAFRHFVVRVDAEKPFGGQLIPGRLTALWPSATDADSGAFFRAEIDRAEFNS